MPELEETLAKIKLFNSEDKTVRQRAQSEIRAMGKEAIPYLNNARGNVAQYPYVEVFQMIANIGDDLFAAGGLAAIDESIIETMAYGTKIQKDSIFSPIAVKDIAIQALTRWGIPIPPPHVEPTRHCHICSKSSQETRIQVCFLLDCDKAVCEAHAAFLESPRSKIWFCSADHRNYANHHPEVMM